MITTTSVRQNNNESKRHVIKTIKSLESMAQNCLGARRGTACEQLSFMPEHNNNNNHNHNNNTMLSELSKNIASVR